MILSETMFHNYVLDKTNKKRWIIMFDSNFDIKGKHLYLVFSTLSKKYTSDSIQFAFINVSESPLIASEYHIQTDPLSNAIPLFISFSEGEEELRIPQTVKSSFNMDLLSESVLADLFDLPRDNQRAKKKN
ncbi:hypothetical protein WA158_005593 [Blastocystis sp. Blastoise]